MTTENLTQKLVEEISYNNSLLALIVSGKFNKAGVHFFTPNTFSQQLAYMKHPAGKIIQPHIHNPVKREVFYTQEVLLIKTGKLRVDFYNEDQEYLESRILETGDLILIAKGGHGFEVIEEVEMIEIKQGPFVGELDKTCFPSVAAQQVKLEVRT